MKNTSVIDLFCGVGGLTHGFVQEGFEVTCGIDNDITCKYAYEKNNKSVFICKDIRQVTGDEINTLYPSNHMRILVGCAPCQPFSTYSNSNQNRDSKWDLLRSFARIVKETQPEIVSMENVPRLTDINKYSVFSEFLNVLKQKKYHIHYEVVNCPDYGIPQVRRRLVLLASKLGEITLIPKTHLPEEYKTVNSVIEGLAPIEAGQQDETDPLHKSRQLSDLNLKRIKFSRPGGTWRDWDEELITNCHKKKSGKSYISVYGRMDGNKPAPTITTQFYGFGSGRFGHPTQNRALSLREGALLQTFPQNYIFCPEDKSISITAIGRHIGNAVPVRLGQVVAKSIKLHLRQYLF